MMTSSVNNEWWSWRQFSQRSTIHGLYEILSAPNTCLGLFWAIILGAAMAMATYEFSGSVKDYSKRPLGISITPFAFNILKLPDVKLCPFGRLNSSYLNEHEFRSELVDYIERAFGGVSVDYYGFEINHVQNKSADRLLENELENKLSRLNLTFAHFIHRATISCRGIIDYCRNSEKRYDCCQTAESRLTMAGKCYRVKGVSQFKPGLGNGLTIRINLSSHLFYDSSNMLHDQGLAVILVEDGTERYNSPFVVRRGAHVAVGVRLNEYQFFNDPPRYRCMAITDQNRDYSSETCFDRCLYDVAFKHCNCTAIAVVHPIPQNHCTPFQHEYCINPTLDKLFDKDPNLVKLCRKFCPPSCEYKEYRSTVSYSDFPSPTIRKILPDTPLESLSNTIFIDLFYEKLEMISYSHHVTRTTEAFVSTLGGQLNLWIGASIVSAIQFMGFLGRKSITELIGVGNCDAKPQYI